MGFDAGLRERFEQLPKGLQDHCWRVSVACRELAQRFNGDIGKAELAGLMHDLARPFQSITLLSLAKSYNLSLSDVDERVPFLLHGPVAAEILGREHGLDDGEVLEAIACHTTGRGGMSLLDKILFISDKIEPQKDLFYPGIDRVRRLAQKDLDQAILCFFDEQIHTLVQEGHFLHPAMIEARNELLAKQALTLEPQGYPLQ